MNLKEIAKEVRKDILLEVYSAQSGHPGGSLSCADILTAIYFSLMNEGDKVVLSKGHASPALYAVLAEKGYFDRKKLKTLRKINSNLQGHIDMNKVPGVDMTTGSLGQGLSVANGMALNSKINH